MRDPQRPLTAIVTGASRGIGRAIAERLAADFDARLMLVYRSRRDDAESTRAACEALGAEVALRQADVSDVEQARGLVEATLERWERVDALINNAGVIADGLFMEMSDEAWSGVLGTNLNGAFFLSRAVARPMLLQKHGRIVNLSSISARRPNRGQANYAASKGALEALTRALAVELASKRITVNAVAPGVTVTEMTGEVLRLAGREIKRAIPMRRLAQPEDIAGIVSFLCGPDAAYITGQVIGVDGGLGL